MFVFRKIWRALFSFNTRFQIRPLPYCQQIQNFVHGSKFKNDTRFSS